MPLLEHALRAVEAVPAIERIVVVLGARADEVRAGVDFGPAEVVVCEDWADGQAASLRCGIEAVADADAAVMTLGDMPRITPQVIARFADLAREHGSRRGRVPSTTASPAIRSCSARDYFEQITALQGDVGARQVLKSIGAHPIECSHLCSRDRRRHARRARGAARLRSARAAAVRNAATRERPANGIDEERVRRRRARREGLRDFVDIWDGIVEDPLAGTSARPEPASFSDAVRRAALAARIGWPARSQSPTPPPTTCTTCSAPWRASRLAATAERWPDAQTTAIGSARRRDPQGCRECRGRGHASIRVCGRYPTRSAPARRGSAARPSGRAGRRSSSRSIVATGRPSSRQPVIPPCRKPASLRTPTAVASFAARSASRSSRPTSTISSAGSAIQASREPKPARSAVIEMAPGMCASSNCWSVRTSTTSTPSLLLSCTWRGVSGAASTPSVSSGAAVERDDRLEVRRLRAERRDRALDEALDVGLAQQRVVRALVADRRGDLHVHPGPTAHRSAEVAGPHLAAVGQRQQLLVEAVEDPARALRAVDGEVRPRDVADEQRVAAEDRPRLVAARAVDERERGVLGAMAGRVQGAHADVAELELPAVVERLVVVAGLRRAGGRGSSRRSRPPAARGRRRGRRGCASRGCVRCARRCTVLGRGTRRSRSADRRPPRLRPRRHRRGRRHSRGRRG